MEDIHDVDGQTSLGKVLGIHLGILGAALGQLHDIVRAILHVNAVRLRYRRRPVIRLVQDGAGADGLPVLHLHLPVDVTVGLFDCPLEGYGLFQLPESRAEDGIMR